MSLHIWDLIYYNINNHSANDPQSEMVYVTNHIGRYNWVYIMAPIFGGAIAGYCARIFEDLQSDGSNSFAQPEAASRAGTIMERSADKVDLLE